MDWDAKRGKNRNKNLRRSGTLRKIWGQEKRICFLILGVKDLMSTANDDMDMGQDYPVLSSTCAYRFVTSNKIIITVVYLLSVST